MCGFRKQNAIGHQALSLLHSLSAVECVHVCVTGNVHSCYEPSSASVTYTHGRL